ncbi:MAG: TPM domain-containing protein [Allosphingosinicella sp.]|uniref:TPM domain-containing protein n=1 Tax=Allosphingosinicella sp. TaxID=2823234 RepID=UPI00395CD1CF
MPRAWLTIAAALLVVLFAAAPGLAQNFPALSGRVVDEAGLLPPAEAAELAARLEQLEAATTRQLVVATVSDLQGYDIRDYGYRLGRHWGIGQERANNGIILLVAPNARRVAIEVGYGLEPIVTDALANRIIDEQILPRFRAGDMAGGIMAGAGALIDQLQAPPEVAEQRILEASQARQARGGRDGNSIFPLIFWGVVLVFIVIPMLRNGLGGGRRYDARGRRRRRRRGMPIVIWGPGMGGGWGGGSSSGWGGGGGGFGGFGGGGFGGGGGSFGGGGASGGW